MRAGLLTENIEIYAPSATTNQFGEESTEYVLKASTKARVVNDNGNRNTHNYEISYSYSKTFQVRIYVNVNEWDRIKWEEKFYRITDINKSKETQSISIKGELIND